MNCIVVDDEPLAREGIKSLVAKTKELKLLDCFSSANAACDFITANAVDLVFLDIQMPGINGLDFAKIVPPETLIVFTTAYAEFALDSYEVEAIDYLIKPVNFDRFQKAVSKAASYLQLLKSESSDSNIETVEEDYFFVRDGNKVFKVQFRDILFIEGLKDYVVLHTDEQKIMTAMNLKTIHEQLPQNLFVRISKSYIINAKQISSFDNNNVFIRQHEIPIGNAYRAYFFDDFVEKRMLSR